ncbi:MAG: DNA repair protein RadC [Bacteroidales bacterium]
MKKINIKDWNKEDRPREKMLSLGAASLSVSELIAILIRNGNEELNAVELARELLYHCKNSLHNLSTFPIEKMTKILGIGTAKAITIKAAFELGKRKSNEILEDKPLVNSSTNVYKIMASHISDLKYEECWILILNRANKLIEKYKVSMGGISSTIVDNRLIIKKAIDNLASGLILVHNHPSGNPTPGIQDKKQTKILKDAAALMNIILLDHIIIAGNRYFSFSDESLIL